MKIKPLFDRVLLKTIQEKSKSTILLPESETKSYMSEVVAVGDDVGAINIGDKVLINKFAGSEFDIDNETFMLIKECDILAVMEEK